MQNRTQCIQRFKHGKFDLILQVFAVELKQYFFGRTQVLKRYSRTSKKKIMPTSCFSFSQESINLLSKL